MAVAATGFFDGVHLGHRKVIEALLSMASARGEQSLVVTFWPHPRTVFQDDARSLKLLTSQKEKMARLSELGVGRVEVLDFCPEFAALTAEEYLRDVLQARFGVTAIVLGYDNRLGSDRLLPADVAPIAARLGLDCEVVGPVSVDGAPVSSTRIRTALEKGDVAAASRMLGFNYPLGGVVVAGNQIGRTIGFPTANTKLYEPLKLVPAAGAYATRVEVLGRTYRGMTNIAHDGKIETHILDFSQYIYGHDITLYFERRLRDEIAFKNLDELKAQLQQDLKSV